MIYLTWYLTIGVVVLAGAVLQFLREERVQSGVSDAILDILEPSRKKPLRRVVNSFGVPALAGTWIIVAWPIVLFLEIKNGLSQRARNIEFEIPEFEIKRESLLERLSASQIEEREKVNDPLSSVPDVPFGFLHGAWKGFLEDVDSEDEIWTFSVREERPLGREKRTSGYVILHGKDIGRYFVTLSKIYQSC